MVLQRTNEFRKDAVRVALTSGLTRKQVADDLGVFQPHVSLFGPFH
jgi:transposase